MADLRRYNFRVHTTRQHKEGNIAGVLLAWLVKQNTTLPAITAIRNAAGTLVFSQASILYVFQQHYTHLYASPDVADAEALHRFLQMLPIPRIALPDRREHDKTIAALDIKQALQALATCKAPGLDSFP